MEALSVVVLTPAGEAIRGGASHFLTITQHDWAGRFHSYDVPGRPRTHNDLEPLFGALRPQERRITRRTVATPRWVIRGPVRVMAAVLSRLKPVDPAQWAWVDPVRWREERQRLRTLQQARVLQRRFRRHPQQFLEALEARLVKLSLPP